MSDLTPTAPVSFHQEYSDFDSLEAAASGWNLDFLQLDSGRFHASLSQVMTSTVVISRITLGRRMLQRGATPPGFRTLGILAEDSSPIKWRGHGVSPEHLMIFPQGQSLESISPPGFDAFALSVSEALLEEFARARGLNGMTDILPNGDLLVIPEQDRSRLGGSILEVLKYSIDRPESISNEAIVKQVDQDFVDDLLEAVNAGSIIENRWEDSPSRSIGFRKALEIMNFRADQAISITEVQEYAGVSERTLRYAFRDAYGMSPKTYLSHLRLNRFRLELLRNPDQALGELAKRWGFWHMGQFSKDYKKLFGELPSETRRSEK